MKLKIPGADYSKSNNRIDFVKFLSSTIEGCSDFPFEPYNPNKSDEFYWVLDRGNDWRIVFSEEAICVITISYRYQCESVKAEESLLAWLSFRINATAI